MEDVLLVLKWRDVDGVKVVDLAFPPQVPLIIRSVRMDWITTLLNVQLPVYAVVTTVVLHVQRPLDVDGVRPVDRVFPPQAPLITRSVRMDWITTLPNVILLRLLVEDTIHVLLVLWQLDVDGVKPVDHVCQLQVQLTTAIVLMDWIISNHNVLFQVLAVDSMDVIRVHCLVDVDGVKRLARVYLQWVPVTILTVIMDWITIITSVKFVS